MEITERIRRRFRNRLVLTVHGLSCKIKNHDLLIACFLLLFFFVFFFLFFLFVFSTLCAIISHFATFEGCFVGEPRISDLNSSNCCGAPTTSKVKGPR